MFVHIPSVRSSILGTLSKYFVHAAEARATPELLGQLQSILASEELSPQVSMQLRKIHRSLSQRGLLDAGSHPGEVPFALVPELDFVVVDSSQFYHETHDTHSPQLLELAKVLNKLGNAHGIRLHVISGDDITRLIGLGEELPYGKIYPVGTVAPHNAIVTQSYDWKLYVPPGAGTNIALRYIASLTSEMPDEPFVSLRMSADTYPRMGKLSYRASEFPSGRLSLLDARKKEKYRNFFRDVSGVILGKYPQPRTSYSGYDDSTGIKLTRYWNRKLRIADFLVRVLRRGDLHYYQTGVNEDTEYASEEPSFRAPGKHLVHAGGKSTWSGKENLLMNVAASPAPAAELTPMSNAFVRRIISNSGVKI
jgi:hypothetical protein